MEINIGVRNAARELSIDVELSAEEVNTKVTEAIAAGTPLVLAEANGHSVIVPAAALGYVEIAAQQNRRVGFGLTD
ncbi:DUF3107 domain-containing protein [Changpingibacter yushuensis]|uniref:DUF3107 domain-containing protein n=1 Tax=Changpingibacter yushuensis TaxID=2758440 RepID=UPI0015F452CE|nr:DUF3107 domain-containing protein [Changpingibacter yushuensis]